MLRDKMSSLHRRNEQSASTRWVARPYNADNKAIASITRAFILFSAVIASYALQIAIGYVAEALSGTRSVSHASLSELSKPMQYAIAVLIAPILDILLVQALGLVVARKILKLNWIFSCLSVGILFGLLHGYSGASLLKIITAGIIFTAVYIIELRKAGRPVIFTAVAHGIYNLKLVCYTSHA